MYRLRGSNILFRIIFGIMDHYPLLETYSENQCDNSNGELTEMSAYDQLCHAKLGGSWSLEKFEY